MVYDISSKGVEKYERINFSGILKGINTDSQRCKVFDPKKGIYSYVNLSCLLPESTEQNPLWFNATIYDVDMNIMKELAEADERLRNKEDVQVTFNYYTVTKEAKDQDGNPIMEEKEEVRGGKVVIVQKPKKNVYNRLSSDDCIKSFKILD